MRKGKLIIIEGVDGTGKTTLIGNLSRALWPEYVFNYTYPKEETWKENLAYAMGEYSASLRIFKEMMSRDKTIICDRFHIGEFAYGPVKRGYPHNSTWERLVQLEIWMLENLPRESVYLLVLLFADPMNALKRLHEKGDIKKEYLQKIDDIRKVNNLYSEAIDRTMLNNHFVFVDDVTRERLLEITTDFIQGKFNK